MANELRRRPASTRARRWQDSHAEAHKRQSSQDYFPRPSIPRQNAAKIDEEDFSRPPPVEICHVVGEMEGLSANIKALSEKLQKPVGPSSKNYEMLKNNIPYAVEAHKKDMFGATADREQIAIKNTIAMNSKANEINILIRQLGVAP